MASEVRSAADRRARCGIAVAVLLAGCTSAPIDRALWSGSARCADWFEALDAAVQAAGVADAGSERIAGVPGLRVDRIGQALLHERSLDSDAAWRAWLARAAALDDAARRAEIDNLARDQLPPEVRDGGAAARGVTDVVEPASAGRDRAHRRTRECRQHVVQQWGTLPPKAREREALLHALRTRAVVPDRYSTFERTVGLYPLLRWPFFSGVQRWQGEHTAAMVRWAASPPPLQRYIEAGAAAMAAGTGGEALPPLPAPDALGLVNPSAPQARRLLAWHAPVFEVEEAGAADRFGAPVPLAAGVPAVDRREPVVYTRLAHTRLGGRWLLQLVYTVWFPERAASGSFDLLAGALDGVIVRLTLAEDGEPMLMDTIHGCGCFHMFFASARLQPREGAPRREEWLFSPAALPPLSASSRLVVQLAAGTHQVSGLAARARDSLAAPAGGAGSTAPMPARRYVLRDEDELRSLSAATGGDAARRSLYRPDGLVAGSERGERTFFWPMGVASAGAMRQWGHHATAFVGRRHFDDVDLVEQRYVRIGPPSAASR